MASFLNPGISKLTLPRHLVLSGVDDRHGAADLRGHPQFGSVVLEFGKARPRVDQNVGDDLARRGVDEMRHVGRLGRVDQRLAVRADGHALGLDANLDVAKARALLEVDHGHRVVVLVGDIEDLAGGILGEQFGVGSGGQAVHHGLRLRVDHLDGVVVADRDHHELAVAREVDAARALADLDGPW
ncbi:hypothetical protein ACVWWG_000960 [Bradyrhizobium sp. LB7.2]